MALYDGNQFVVIPYADGTGDGLPGASRPTASSPALNLHHQRVQCLHDYSVAGLDLI